MTDTRPTVVQVPPLIPPLRFGQVQPNLYRGSYPQPHSVRFLRRLNLKTIVSLTPEPLSSPDITAFASENGITLIHLECGATKSKSKKKRGVPLQPEVAHRAIELMIDSDMAPLYIHCMNGSQVTCLAVACLRKLSFWSLAAIADEFLRYCELDSADENFVESFSAEISVPKNTVPWVWKGLSKSGVVLNHPKLRITKMDEASELVDANDTPV